MRILFATNHTYLPDRAGGSESSIHELCLALKRAGIVCAVLARASDAHPRNHLRRWLGRPSDEDLGYPVYRRPDPARCALVVRHFKPSLAIVQTGDPVALCRRLEDRGVPSAIYFRDAQLHKLGETVEVTSKRLYLANSQFTADRYREAFHIDPLVLPPLVLPELYRTQALGDRVVFVTPHRFKGFDTVLQLARSRPDIPFDVVDCWPLGRSLDEEVQERLRGIDNICFRPRTQGLRSVYARARLLLAPSLGERGVWEEGWGRVVTEAQCSGIPVLGSNSGGLPESIGPGGIVVNADAPIGDWKAALSRVWDGPAEHARLSEAARLHSRRPAIAPQQLANGLLETLDKFLERCSQET